MPLQVSVPTRDDPTADEIPRSLRQRERERLTETQAGDIVTRVANADGTTVDTDLVVLLTGIARDLRTIAAFVERVDGFQFHVTNDEP